MVELENASVLETARLKLRAPQRADVRRIATLAGDIDVARMTSRMPHPYSCADAHAFLDRVETHDLANERVFAVEDRAEGFVGMLGFHPTPQGVELGYWFGKPYWGRGLATEAAEAALVWAKDGWKRRYILARHFADNPASGAVLCKAGFLYTGERLVQDSLARGAAAETRTMVWMA
jgi:RimJ/RimL family protein N-acetyltransferase